MRGITTPPLSILLLKIWKGHVFTIPIPKKVTFSRRIACATRISNPFFPGIPSNQLRMIPPICQVWGGRSWGCSKWFLKGKMSIPPQKKKSFVGDFRPQVIQTSGGLFGDPWAATTKGVHPFSWVPLKVIPPFVQATNHTTSPLLSPQTKHTPKLQGTRSTKPRCAKVFACGEVACGKITLRKPQRRYP